MKRFFAWILMVVLFTGLLVGGTLGFFYWQADESHLPDSQITLAGQTLSQPVGYSWRLPVFGGALWRTHSLSPGQAIQTLEPILQDSAPLELPQGLNLEDSQLTLTTQDGQKVFEGDGLEWNQFRFGANGSYLLTIVAANEGYEQGKADAQGWYQYQCRFTVQAPALLTLSASSIAQGDSLAVYVSGVLDQTQTPVGESDLGSIWFTPVSGGWVGYLGASYNTSGGSHTITVTVGQQQLTATVEVTASSYGTTTTQPDSSTAQANEQFFNTMYGLYTQGSSEKYWSGGFTAPVEGTVYQPYGAKLTLPDGSSGGQSASVTYMAALHAPVKVPAPGKVVLAKQLELTGNTVVIDHGCGVKSYLFYLDSLSVQQGQQVEQGQQLGQCDKLVTWEVRIGNKTIDPAKLLKTSGGLFYQPR